MINAERDNRGNPVQNIIFIILFIIGAFLACSIEMAEMHEEGHVMAAKRHGYKAEITAKNETTVYGELTTGILIAGFLAEFSTMAGLAFIFFLISHSKKGGLRQFYGHIGFFWGYANAIFWYALCSTDFLNYSNITGNIIFHGWYIFCLPVLIIGWFALFLSRLLKIFAKSW